MYTGVQCIQVLSIWRSGEIETKSKVKNKHDHLIAKFTMSLPHFHHIVKTFTYSAFEKYRLKNHLILYFSFDHIYSEKFQISAECSM